MNCKFMASMMCANYGNLESEVRTLEEGNIDSFHIDIMDGRYVPNFAMSLNDMSYIARATDKPLDVHLMVEHPSNTVGLFINQLRAGDTIYIHPEAEYHPSTTLQKIIDAGMVPGIAINPGTSVETLLPWLPQIELVLVMTVEPGFGGQSFMPEQLKKVEFLHHYFKQQTSAFHRPHIQVDGGLGEEHVRQAARAGANCIVAGTSVFRSPHGTATAVEILHAAQEELAR